MRKVLIVFSVILIAITLSSCCSTEPETGRLGMYPMRNIPVTTIEDLQSGSFEVLGTVRGVGCVDVDHPDRGNTHAYASLEVAEVARMYYESDEFTVNDSYFVSLSNAIHQMIENARELDASFIVFPSYTIEVVDYQVKTVVTATAIKLINAPGVVSASEPAGTINIALQ